MRRRNLPLGPGEAARRGKTARTRISAEPCRARRRRRGRAGEPNGLPCPARNAGAHADSGASFRGRRAGGFGRRRACRRTAFPPPVFCSALHRLEKEPGTAREPAGASSGRTLAPFRKILPYDQSEEPARTPQDAGTRSRKSGPGPSARRNRLRHFPALRNFRETGRLRRLWYHFVPTVRRRYGIAPAADRARRRPPGKNHVIPRPSKIGIRWHADCFAKGVQGRFPVA